MHRNNQQNPAHNPKQSRSGHFAQGEIILNQISDSGKWLELAEGCGFRVANIIENLHVSPRQFRRIVKIIFGGAPEEVLTDWRLVLSKKVLSRNS